MRFASGAPWGGRGSERRWLLFSYVVWLPCLLLPGCTAAHDGWAPAAKPIPVGFMILLSLMVTPTLIAQFQIGALAAVANWAFVLSPICLTRTVERRPWLPLTLTILLPGYWVLGLMQAISTKRDGPLLYGYYAAGVAYVLAAIGCWLIWRDCKRQAAHRVAAESERTDVVET